MKNAKLVLKAYTFFTDEIANAEFNVQYIKHENFKKFVIQEREAFKEYVNELWTNVTVHYYVEGCKDEEVDVYL